MTTFLSGLNLIRWLALRAGVRGASHPQQIALSDNSTAAQSHTSGPMPLTPQRRKC